MPWQLNNEQRGVSDWSPADEFASVPCRTTCFRLMQLLQLCRKKTCACCPVINLSSQLLRVMSWVYKHIAWFSTALITDVSAEAAPTSWWSLSLPLCGWSYCTAGVNVNTQGYMKAQNWLGRDWTVWVSFFHPEPYQSEVSGGPFSVTRPWLHSGEGKGAQTTSDF